MSVKISRKRRKPIDKVIISDDDYEENVNDSWFSIGKLRILSTLAVVSIIAAGLYYHNHRSYILQQQQDIYVGLLQKANLLGIGQGDSSSDIAKQENNDIKDAVIGIAHNIDTKNLVVFCSSLHESINQGKGDYIGHPVDIILFINSPLSTRTREIIEKFPNIIPVEYNVKSFDDKYQKYHPSTLRWMMIYRYFVESSTQYHRILMIDIRDSYFQSNPFQMITTTEDKSYFYSFNGVETLSIRQCGWNGEWVRDCFGSDVLEEIGSRAIICSGVSFGTYDTTIKYLQLMNDIVHGISTPETTSVIQKVHPKFPSCERNGVDQGVHNVIMHKNLIPNIRLIPQSSSMVMNMQAKKATISSDFIVRNFLGNAVSVVHQYDRYPELQNFLFKKYVYWLDGSDVASYWNDEPTCNSYTYRVDEDMLKGRMLNGKLCIVLLSWSL